MSSGNQRFDPCQHYLLKSLDLALRVTSVTHINKFESTFLIRTTRVGFPYIRYNIGVIQLLPNTMFHPHIDTKHSEMRVSVFSIRMPSSTVCTSKFFVERIALLSSFSHRRCPIISTVLCRRQIKKKQKKQSACMKWKVKKGGNLSIAPLYICN